MNADSCFHIGKAHKVCQDYALHLNEGTVRGLVCDGCSSSPHTDFGSRLLARSASFTLGFPGTVFRARDWAMSLSLPMTAVDATLLVVEQTDLRTVRARAWGDGVIAARRRATEDGPGSIDYFVIRFPSGAPAYPNYLADDERAGVYLRESQNGLAVVDICQDGEVLDAFRVEGLQYDGTFTQEFDAEYYDLVVVLSDGAESFQRRTAIGFEPIPVWEIVRRVMAVQGTAGEFIARRVGRLIKDIQKDGGQFTDDFSAAAIYLGDAP